MVGVGAAGFASTGLPSLAAEAGGKVKLNEKDVILFQGDSITDAGREKKEPGRESRVLVVATPA